MEQGASFEEVNVETDLIKYNLGVDKYVNRMIHGLASDPNPSNYVRGLFDFMFNEKGYLQRIQGNTPAMFEAIQMLYDWKRCGDWGIIKSQYAAKLYMQSLYGPTASIPHFHTLDRPAAAAAMLLQQGDGSKSIPTIFSEENSANGIIKVNVLGHFPLSPEQRKEKLVTIEAIKRLVGAIQDIPFFQQDVLAALNKYGAHLSAAVESMKGMTSRNLSDIQREFHEGTLGQSGPSLLSVCIEIFTAAFMEQLFYFSLYDMLYTRPECRGAIVGQMQGLLGSQADPGAMADKDLVRYVNSLKMKLSELTHLVDIDEAYKLLSQPAYLVQTIEDVCAAMEETVLSFHKRVRVKQQVVTVSASTPLVAMYRYRVQSSLDKVSHMYRPQPEGTGRHAAFEAIALNWGNGFKETADNFTRYKEVTSRLQQVARVHLRYLAELQLQIVPASQTSAEIMERFEAPRQAVERAAMAPPKPVRPKGFTIATMVDEWNKLNTTSRNVFNKSYSRASAYIRRLEMMQQELSSLDSNIGSRLKLKNTDKNRTVAEVRARMSELETEILQRLRVVNRPLGPSKRGKKQGLSVVKKSMKVTSRRGGDVAIPVTMQDGGTFRTLSVIERGLVEEEVDLLFDTLYPSCMYHGRLYLVDIAAVAIGIADPAAYMTTTSSDRMLPMWEHYLPRSAGMAIPNRMFLSDVGTLEAAKQNAVQIHMIDVNDLAFVYSIYKVERGLAFFDPGLFVCLRHIELMLPHVSDTKIKQATPRMSVRMSIRNKTPASVPAMLQARSSSKAISPVQSEQSKSEERPATQKMSSHTPKKGHVEHKPPASVPARLSSKAISPLSIAKAHSAPVNAEPTSQRNKKQGTTRNARLVINVTKGTVPAMVDTNVPVQTNVAVPVNERHTKITKGT